MGEHDTTARAYGTPLEHHEGLLPPVVFGDKPHRRCISDSERFGVTHRLRGHGYLHKVLTALHIHTDQFLASVNQSEHTLWR